MPSTPFNPSGGDIRIKTSESNPNSVSFGNRKIRVKKENGNEQNATAIFVKASENAQQATQVYPKVEIWTVGNDLGSANHGDINVDNAGDEGPMHLRGAFIDEAGNRKFITPDFRGSISIARGLPYNIINSNPSLEARRTLFGAHPFLFAFRAEVDTGGGTGRGGWTYNFVKGLPAELNPLFYSKVIASKSQATSIIQIGGHGNAGGGSNCGPNNGNTHPDDHIHHVGFYRSGECRKPSALDTREFLNPNTGEIEKYYTPPISSSITGINHSYSDLVIAGVNYGKVRKWNFVGNATTTGGGISWKQNDPAFDTISHLQIRWSNGGGGNQDTYGFWRKIDNYQPQYSNLANDCKYAVTEPGNGSGFSYLSDIRLVVEYTG
jgi:hypothetical protein